MINKQSKKEKTIERVVKTVALAITIGICIILGSCSMEDVCGTVDGFDVDCTNSGPDCIYYLYLDGQKVSVNRDTWNTTQYGEEICIGY